jgi:hypothetical protein
MPRPVVRQIRVECSLQGLQVIGCQGSSGTTAIGIESTRWRCGRSSNNTAPAPWTWHAPESCSRMHGRHSLTTGGNWQRMIGRPAEKTLTVSNKRGRRRAMPGLCASAAVRLRRRTIRHSREDRDGAGSSLHDASSGASPPDSNRPESRAPCKMIPPFVPSRILTQRSQFVALHNRMLRRTFGPPALIG